MFRICPLLPERGGSNVCLLGNHNHGDLDEHLRFWTHQGQKVRPARQIGEPFSGAGAKGIYSTWYLVQNRIRLFYVQQKSMKDLQCWPQTSRFIAASIHRPKPLSCNRIQASTPNENVVDPSDVFQLDTTVKFVKSNVLAAEWRYVVPTSNNSDNKYATMFWSWLFREMCSFEHSIDEVFRAIPVSNLCQVEGRQLTCTTSGNECRDAPNVDIFPCGHMLGIGYPPLRPPISGGTPSSISVLRTLGDCAKALVSHFASEVGCRVPNEVLKPTFPDLARILVTYRRWFEKSRCDWNILSAKSITYELTLRVRTRLTTRHPNFFHPMFFDK